MGRVDRLLHEASLRTSAPLLGMPVDMRPATRSRCNGSIPRPYCCHHCANMTSVLRTNLTPLCYQTPLMYVRMVEHMTLPVRGSPNGFRRQVREFGFAARDVVVVQVQQERLNPTLRPSLWTVSVCQRKSLPRRIGTPHERLILTGTVLP
jgi:hypothetical protein